MNKLGNWIIIRVIDPPFNDVFPRIWMNAGMESENPIRFSIETSSSVSFYLLIEILVVILSGEQKNAYF